MKFKYLLPSLFLLSYTFCAEEDISYAIYDYTNQMYMNELNKSQKRPLGELTTLMVLYIIFDELEKSKISINSEIPITDGALSQAKSRLFLTAQHSITVQNAIESIIINSANDVAFAVAEHISGSLENFTKKMNAKAQELGMKDTHFETPLVSTDDRNYSTAHDINILVNNIMYNHTQYYDYFEYKKFDFENNTYTNSNNLIGYKGVDGIKASHVGDNSPWDIVVSYMINGHRIVIVNLGYKNLEERTKTTKKIVDEIAKKLPLIEHGKTGEEVIKSMAGQKYYKSNLQKPQTIATEEPDVEVDFSERIAAFNDNDTTTKTTQPKPKLIEEKITKTDNLNTKTNDNIYKVQLGAYKYKNNADEKIKYIKIKYRYIEEDMVFIKNMKIENKNYYKPIINNLAKEQAQKICDYIKSNKDECFVTK